MTRFLARFLTGFLARFLTWFLARILTRVFGEGKNLKYSVQCTVLLGRKNTLYSTTWTEKTYNTVFFTKKCLLFLVVVSKARLRTILTGLFADFPVVFGQVVGVFFGQIFEQIFGQVFHQISGQGFDQGLNPVLGRGKIINTVYSSTRPKEKALKTKEKTSKIPNP